MESRPTVVMNPQTIYPLPAVRAVALHTQGLDAPAGRARNISGVGSVGADEVYAAIKRVGWVQIDTLQVVRRAPVPNAVVAAGQLRPGFAGRAAVRRGQRIPRQRPPSVRVLDSRRLHHPARPLPLPYADDAALPRGPRGWRRRWADDPDNARLLDSILESVRENGAARPVDFRAERKKPGQWWNWDSAKIALEHLYNVGDLAISNRVTFSASMTRGIGFCRAGLIEQSRPSRKGSGICWKRPCGRRASARPFR